MKRLVLGAFVAIAVMTSFGGEARAAVQINLNLGAPPVFAVVPGTPVYYAPAAPANMFFYANQYWLFNGQWYAGPSWNGPWTVVVAPYVPAPILRVPVRYYHVPPPAWRAWRRDAPPHWAGPYGRDWHEQPHEQHWRENEEHWSSHAHACPPGHAKQGRC